MTFVLWLVLIALGASVIFSSILQIVEAALSIWKSKLRQKYIDKVDSLKRAYYAEYNKPAAERSDAVLDNLEFELKITCASLAADIRLAGNS